MSSDEDPVDMSSFFGAEGDECPICLEPMPVMTHRGTERCRHPCCGKWTCPECVAKMTIPRGGGGGGRPRQRSVARAATSEKERRTKRPLDERPAKKRAAPDQPGAGACPEGGSACLLPCHLCRARIPPSLSRDYLPLLLKNAEKGRAWAQYLVGRAYDKGEGAERNFREAARWCRLAAERGHPLAQYALGHYLENGKGVRRSVAEARSWYEKSASGAGYLYAQNDLGRLLLDGLRGVDRDPGEAARLFRLSADQGCHQAQCSLGNCYSDGIGIPRDLEQALFWYTKAAEQGNANAMNNVAAMLTEIATEKYGGIEITGKCPIPRILKWGRRAMAHGCAGAARPTAKLEAKLSSSCASCQIPKPADGQLLRCKKCKAMHYCSKECQVQHWKAGHKKDCCDQD